MLTGYNCILLDVKKADAKDVEEMKRNREEAIQYFSGQFEKMLIENIDDYVKNFDSYTSPKENAENI